MKKVYIVYFFILLILLGPTACNEALEPNPANLGYDYYPLNSGDERIYEVTQVNYQRLITSDTLRYQLKEVVGVSFSSGGEESYKIERFVRDASANEWETDSVWSTRVNTYQAVMVENNVPIIKLSFPVQENRKWDGNAMNSRLFDEFKMIDVGISYSIDDIHFDQSLILEKEGLLDTCYLSNDNYHIEVYGKGIGLVHRIDIDRKYISQGNCADSGIVESATEIEYKLVNHNIGE